jgi:hypothetical protein
MPNGPGFGRGLGVHLSRVSLTRAVPSTAAAWRPGPSYQGEPDEESTARLQMDCGQFRVGAYLALPSRTQVFVIRSEGLAFDCID